MTTAKGNLPVFEVCCTPLSTAPLARPHAEQLAQLLKAVADPTRLQLLSLIASTPGRTACVCDLTESLRLTQPTVSHHLRVLVEGGFLTRERRGPWAYFAIVDERLDDVRALLSVS